MHVSRTHDTPGCYCGTYTASEDGYISPYAAALRPSSIGRRDGDDRLGLSWSPILVSESATILGILITLVCRSNNAKDDLKNAWQSCARRRTTTGPITTFHGRYYHYDAIHLTPKPYQKPHPPIWIGAFGPKSIARAGRLGEVWGAAPFLDSVDAVKAQLDIYREAAIKAGKTPRIALLRDGWIASSIEEAEQTFGRLWVEECKFYFRWGMLAPTSEFRSESDFTLKSVRRHMVLGTAADWLDQLHYWQALFGAEWLILRCRLPLGPSAEQTRECIQRLGKRCYRNSSVWRK